MSEEKSAVKALGDSAGPSVQSTTSALPDSSAPSTVPLPGVYIKTYGCQMNEYDSEKMFSLLSKDYRPVSSAEEADVVLINTCSVREKAESKLNSTLGRLAKMKKKKPDVVVGVTGCVAQQEGNKLLKKSKAVNFVIGTHNLSLVPSLVEGARNGASPQAAIDYREEWEDLPEDLDAYPQTEDFAQNSQSAFGNYYTPVRAMVAIQRGCNKHCAFCVVPTTRGPEVSRSADEIEREVSLKVRLGAREVLLLGQTVNSYGRDLSPRYPFESLIRRLAEIDGLERIRFTSPHPQDVKKGFLDLYAEVPELCPHIHLPMQSGSDRILKLMNRNYRTKRYFEIVDELKQRCPDIAITSDFIVGFPTETEEDFEMTLDAMKRVRYSLSYSFIYSRRPNTTAIEQYSESDSIPLEVAKERLYRVQELQKELGLEFNDKLLGTVVEVLVEGRAKKISSRMRGRIAQNTPVELTGGLPEPGSIVLARVEHSGPYGLRASLLDEKNET